MQWDATLRDVFGIELQRGAVHYGRVGEVELSEGYFGRSGTQQALRKDELVQLPREKFGQVSERSGDHLKAKSENDM